MMRWKTRAIILTMLLLRLRLSISAVLPAIIENKHSSKSPIAVASVQQTSAHRNLTVTFTGSFNLTTTVKLDDSTKEALLFPNGTVKPSLPWSLSSGFNFSASHGPVRASVGGGAGGGGNGDGAAGGGSVGVKETGGTGAGRGGLGAFGAGVGIGGLVEVNGRAIAGFGAADAYAEGGGGGASTGGVRGGCATGGGSSGRKSGVGRACTGNKATSRLALSHRNLEMTNAIEYVLRQNSTRYSRVDRLGAGASAGAAAGNGTGNFAGAIGKGAGKNGTTFTAAFGTENGGDSRSSSGKEAGGTGQTRSESNESAGLHGLDVGVGRAVATGTGGGSAVAASGRSESIANSAAKEFGEVLDGGEP